jgi:hypothetical protein
VTGGRALAVGDRVATYPIDARLCCRSAFSVAMIMPGFPAYPYTRPSDKRSASWPLLGFTHRDQEAAAELATWAA